YQATEISIEYFKYSTTTSVSIQYTSSVVTPTVVVGFTALYGWLGYSTSELFRRLNLDSNILIARIRQSETIIVHTENKEIDPNSILNIRNFIKYDFYYYHISPKYPFQYSRSDIHTVPNRMFEFQLTFRPSLLPLAKL